MKWVKSQSRKNGRCLKQLSLPNYQVNQCFWHVGTSIETRLLAVLTLQRDLGFSATDDMFCLLSWHMWSRSVSERVKQKESGLFLKIVSLLLMRRAESTRNHVLCWVDGWFIPMLPPRFNDVRAAEIHVCTYPSLLLFNVHTVLKCHKLLTWMAINTCFVCDCDTIVPHNLRHNDVRC